jgi:Bacteriocin-protection, YdeI or OmpD-Associated
MMPPGLAAFERRDPARSGIYSFERQDSSFSRSLARQFKATKAAWGFFEAQPPGYRRMATHWVMSAKRDETRQRRLALLMRASEQHRRFGLLAGTTNRT